jgi:hypothetical protein
MNRSLLVATAGLALLLVACDNVDKDGTADKLIDDIERVQNVTLDDTQSQCVTDLVKSKSDDELRDLADGEVDEATRTAFGEELEECLRGTGVTVPDGSDSATTTGDTSGETSTTTTVDPAAVTTAAPTTTTV